MQGNEGNMKAKNVRTMRRHEETSCQKMAKIIEPHNFKKTRSEKNVALAVIRASSALDEPLKSRPRLTSGYQTCLQLPST